jgi:hypothetical protein
MRQLIFIGAISAALAGCTTAELDANMKRAQAVARASIDAICANLPVAQASFEALVATGKLKPALVTRGRQSITALNAVCVAPPSDTATAIATASRVLAAVIQATAEARAQAQP